MCMLRDQQSGYQYDLAGLLRGGSAAASRACEPRPTSERARLCQAVDQELQHIVRAQSELDAREARCLREADRLEVWRDFGYPSILAYLEYRLGYAPRTASDRMRVARALAELPEIEAALERGELFHSAVRELTRVADARTERAWIERARGKNVRDIEELVRGHKKGAHPDDDKDPDLRTRKVTIEMTPATYALYRQVQATLADETGHRLDEDEVIATMCRRSLEHGDEPGEPPAMARYQIAVTICERCDRGWQDAAGATIEIEPAAVEVARCDAQHIGSLDAARPVRATQDVTPATRRLVWRRDHGRCRTTGCRSARNLDVHHIEHRADGGGHDASNLAVLCSGCHLALHRGLLVVTGSAPDFVFTRIHELPTSMPAEESGPPRDGDRLAAATLKVQARDVLVASGFRKHEASAAVDAAIAHVGSKVSLEELLREAFRRCKPKPG